MSSHREGRWDDDPVGDLDEGKRRRWRRPWNAYLSILFGLFGAFMTIGALSARDWSGVLGGLCVLAVPAALVGADGPRARAGRPPPPPPLPRVELLWNAAALALVVLGVVLTTV